MNTELESFNIDAGINFIINTFCRDYAKYGIAREDLEQIGQVVYLQLLKNNTDLDIKKVLSHLHYRIRLYYLSYKYNEGRISSNDVDSYGSESSSIYDPAQNVENMDQYRKLHECIMKLDVVSRYIVNEVYFSEKKPTIKEIGDSVNLSESRVYAKLKIAEKKLKRWLEISNE